jgi:hypothetical protein
MSDPLSPVHFFAESGKSLCGAHGERFAIDWPHVTCEVCRETQAEKDVASRYRATTYQGVEIAGAGYTEIGAEIGKLVAEKQHAYGDAFGKSGAVMRILYPDGIPAEKLDDALTVVRVLDKLFRVATAPPSGDPMGESPWRDVCGYSILAIRRAEKK